MIRSMSIGAAEGLIRYLRRKVCGLCGGRCGRKCAAAVEVDDLGFQVDKLRAHVGALALELEALQEAITDGRIP